MLLLEFVVVPLCLVYLLFFGACLCHCYLDRSLRSLAVVVVGSCGCCLLLLLLLLSTCVFGLLLFLAVANV